MNDQDFAVLLRDAAEPVDAPDFVGTAVRRAARVRRRRRSLIVGVTAAGMAATVVVAVVVQTNSDTRSTPAKPSDTIQSADATTAPARTATPPPSAAPLTRSMVQQQWTSDRLGELPWLDIGLPRSISGSTSGLPVLSSDPVHRALAAVEAEAPDGTRVVVLGDDGNWRVVDQDFVRARDAGGYSSPALWGASLTTDGTALAVPQPQALVVVDLTTGASTRYDVPGFNKSVAWSPDNQKVLLTTEERPGGSLVDLDTGAVSQVPYGYTTSFAPDGAAVQVARTGTFSDELRTYRSDSEEPDAIEGVQNLSGNLQGQGPIVSASVLAGVTAQGATPMASINGGVLVIDRQTGDPVTLLAMQNWAYIYQTEVLGWVDEQTMLLHIPALSPTDSSHLIAWNYVTGELRRVSDLPSLKVSVASGLLG
jgi:hypothetical protein